MPVSSRTRRIALAASIACMSGCTSIDPGPQFVIPSVTFDADYFYCHVEPEFIFANNCGPGDPSLGDRANGCHFNPSAVSGMPLLDHPAIDCGGGDHPVDPTTTGAGTPAQSNFASVSFEMDTNYTQAAIFVRPSGNNHPRAIFSPDDPTVNQILATWASK